MTMKVVMLHLNFRKCAIRSSAEPLGDGMASSNFIYIPAIKTDQSISEERVSRTSCIVYFFLASRGHLSIDPKCPNIDPRPKLAKAPSRIVIALNSRCSARDRSPILEKIRRPIIRSDRERAVAKHLHEREIMFCQNCFRLPKVAKSLGEISISYSVGLWGLECGDDILKREAYTIGGTIGFVRVQAI